MDILVKIDRFQIKQNILNLKSTRMIIFYQPPPLRPSPLIDDGRPLIELSTAYAVNFGDKSL